MTDTTRVNWRDLDLTTAAGVVGIDREIAARQGVDYDALVKEPKTLRTLEWWTESLDAAMRLPVDHEHQFELSRHRLALDPGQRYKCVIVDRNGHVATEAGDTAAIAICKAWLAWHDAAHPEGDTAHPEGDTA